MKKTNQNLEKLRPLLIAGQVPDVGDLALRRVLRAKDRGQALIVVDCQGSLATCLTEKNKGNLHKSPLLWCDLSNRRRPIALFRFTRSPGMKPALRRFIEHVSCHVSAFVSAPTIDAVVELAYRMADQGSIGLAALVRSLRRPETSHSLRSDPAIAAELDRLVGLLDWVLRFPAVWSASEGNNVVDLRHHLSRGGTVWLELPASHFERLEHQVVSWMVDAALMAALHPDDDGKSPGGASAHVPLLMYGFPPACPLPLAGGEVAAKPIGLFGFSARYALPEPARYWLEADADCWIVGSMADLASSKCKWLNEAEQTRLQDLQPGQVWVRSGADRKAVTVRVHPAETKASLAQGFRRQALKQLRLTPVKQFSSALATADTRAPQNTDLFRRLATKEALYAGWFRVKSHRRDSHGCDFVSIEQFGSMLDAELQRLALELAEGRYRCRPLRTARIPKPDGDVRVLRIACVRDRVVQAACLHLIEPLFDVRFSPASFAYRPGRGAHHAVALARSAIQSGKHWAVTADIRKCFDTIDHDIVLRLVGDVIGDRDLVQLIRHWLVADVIDFMDVIPSELGVPQGEAISPLLANIYLDPLDKEFERAGTSFVRYADDYLVLCDTEVEAQAALRQMGEFLQGVLKLSLKPAKTYYSHVGKGVGFLGFLIGLSDVHLPPDRMSRGLHNLDSLVHAMALPGATSFDKYDAIMRINSRIAGFRNYFLIDNAPGIRTQLAELDAAADALAGKQLATPGGMEPAWTLRERFLPDAERALRQSRIAAETAILTGTYPPHGPSRLANGLAKGQSDGETLSSPPSAAAPALEAAPGSNSENAHLSNDPDVLLIEGRLHVMKSGCYVTVSGDDVVVKRRKNEIFRMAISQLTMVYLEGKGIALSADLTMRLCEDDVPVVFTPLVGIPAAIAQPVQSTRSSLRQQQVLRRNDPDILKVGLGMLSAKVANQASVLKYFARYRKRTDDAVYTSLTRCADDIRGIAQTLDGADPSAAGARASAMGFEGRAAAKYWSSFALLIPDDLTFSGRHTRNATDAVNSAINYIYGMMYGEVWRAVVRAGLDPYFGIMHGTERDQGSLVFDLIEEYRAPFGDRLILGMLGRGFALELDKEGRLHTASRHKLVHAFHRQWHRQVRWRGKMRTPFDILDLQVTSLKNTYLGKEEYRSFRFRW